MAAKSPEAEPGGGAEPGSSFLGHGAGLVRVTAIDLAILAGHALLYPTGILPERSHLAPDRPPDEPDPQGAQDAGTPSATAPPAMTLDSASDAGTDPGDGPPARPGAKAKSRPPVLLVHGFVDNRSAFALLRRSLQRNGWTRIQAVNYSPLTSDVRTAAAVLGTHIERICEESGERRVDIVAHSLGGLIARYYVQRLGGDAQVRTLVTLGTPHNGTRAIPALIPHPLARQMRPGSAVLEELAKPVRRCRTRFVAFWSDLDQLMIPVESARLEHPGLSAKNIKVTGIGHLALPVHGAVAAEIRRELSGGPGRPGAADAA
ncbi:esterase/lipase family protein [Actinacidiphila acidipaludis]|uniref:Alpha/beta fold hydrolase n=1 Tax=Actinacidiphila acidipaludis TaxID=2873382 RepID=A0ABS7QB60_9ACTN|nr:alpha/beta fold hydrolase [Streptomyces acidipaludis]MBY8880417.1 alpha/beta fold hydrolase [Streptomyces acidipaludis]